MLYASLEWLRESDAITDNDIEVFNKVKQCRNNIAHEISRMLSEGLPKDFADRFGDMTSLIAKVERWWIVYFEIPLNPEVANREINEDELVPGPIAGLKMMIDVALGDDEISKYYINEFRKQFPNHKFSISSPLDNLPPPS